MERLVIASGSAPSLVNAAWYMDLLAANRVPANAMPNERPTCRKVAIRADAVPRL